ncbi:formyltransferase family protein, partial [Legionella tunisiensis]|uniref:formyltransferase family protein n=1 Tax=Legionella tunisiensis TaxID=1034944 RepID=UPI00035E8900
DELLINDLNDPALYDFLINESASAFLFTGGGIVPAKLLEIATHKFIHIHPGYLPDFRGADCTLWSSFLTGQTSASCFYMSPGIDDGDVILAKWLPKPILKEEFKSIETKTQYRFIYSFVDPWVRSFVLRELVSSYTDFLSINAVQQQNDGTMYYFMHEKMKALVFNML